MRKKLKYNELALKYESTSQLYEEISFDIEEQLANKSLSSTYFINEIKTKMNHLKKAPKVPNKIFRKYMKNVDLHFKLMGRPNRNVSNQQTKIQITETSAPIPNENDLLTQASPEIKTLISQVTDARAGLTYSDSQNVRSLPKTYRPHYLTPQRIPKGSTPDAPRSMTFDAAIASTNRLQNEDIHMKAMAQQHRNYYSS